MKMKLQKISCLPGFNKLVNPDPGRKESKRPITLSLFFTNVYSKNNNRSEIK